MSPLRFKNMGVVVQTALDHGLLQISSDNSYLLQPQCLNHNIML